MEIMVSIICNTYNQESYLRQIVLLIKKQISTLR